MATPVVPHYNLQTAPDESLGPQEYYFVCDISGHYLKTKSNDEYKEVCSWDNILFQSKVKTNQHIHFKISGSWKKKAVSRLQTSQPLESGVFDFHLLQEELSSHISEVKLGGKEKTETYEML